MSLYEFNKTIEKENIAKRYVNEMRLTNTFKILVLKNEDNEIKHYQYPVNSSFIQFHFCLSGSVKFYFGPHYNLNLDEEKSLLLYNPQQDLPMQIDLAPKSQMVSIVVAIKKFHTLFSKEADCIPFLSSENRDKKYYKNNSLSPTMLIALNQLTNFGLSTSVKKLYFKAKCYELLSLYFSESEDAIEQCPFLANESDVLKIKQAKHIMMENVTEPPSLPELASQVGLSLKKLKEGFKQIYGNSVFGFLFDYKMEIARQMLESNQYNVNEVGLQVGYSTASHFIAAFKKKYGTTPKKYLKSIQ